MRILFLSGWFPYPPDNGARLRSYNLLRQLALRHDVSLLSFVRDGADRQIDQTSVSSFCRVLGVVPYQESQALGLRALLYLLSATPRSVLETYSPQMAMLVQETLYREQFDVLIASEIGPGVCTVPYILGSEGVPRVIEDLELSMIWSKVQVEHTWLGRVRHGLMWLKQRRYVAHIFRHIDGCTVASESERALLQRVAPDLASVTVIPNGVDSKSYEGDWGHPVPDTLIFPGSLTYRANFDAMAFFLRSVFPLIRVRRPGVTLRVTGRTDGVDLHHLPACEGVVFTGYLQDIRPALAASCVCVVPLLTGGGTRLKILEAMALGTPVVSTSKGAEGLEVCHGEDLLIADEPTEFADAVLLLLEDETLCARLRSSGQRLVRERYGWEQIGTKLDEFIHQVVLGSDRRGSE